MPLAIVDLYKYISIESRCARRLNVEDIVGHARKQGYSIYYKSAFQGSGTYKEHMQRCGPDFPIKAKGAFF